ncbi:MAG: alpha-amylase/4-alpha-glucanotransferase domain-containing protein, partial [Thermodesulfobacteriota bacterium]
MIYLPFCIHNHQPAGNFDFVLEDAYRQSYWPFLKLLHGFSAIKMTIHNTGYLLDWIARVHPEYIELLSLMVNRGQVEIMGGGFFEPILAVIPDNDRAAQIGMMSDRIEELFGVRPTGLWLAERVWEPTLPTSLNKAGVDYVLVDDFHFIKAGLRRAELGGYYITEDRGRAVKIFPGSEALRYLIPFHTVPELKAHLQGLGGKLKGGNAAIYGDDGEKFGVWPGTHKLVFKDGWLKRFFEMIQETGDVTPITLGEYALREKPLGRVYLPTCSYMEMGEWSLPAGAGRDYGRLMESLKDKKESKRFIQGGTWRGFFAKYPESNWMHKRMLMASALLEKKRAENTLPKETLRKAAESLYASECNDAYWHGIFGGLYLPHLRTEVYKNILTCESVLMTGDEVGTCAESLDVDADGLPELIISSGDSRLFMSPEFGGAAFELDSLFLGLNAMNVLTRW